MPTGVLLSCRPRRYWRVARAAAFGHTIPATSFNSCVLPAPLAPASTQRSPGRMVQLMPFRTVRPPRCRLRRTRRTSRYRVPALLIGRIGSQPRAADGLFLMLQGLRADLRGSDASAAVRAPVLAHLGGLGVVTCTCVAAVPVDGGGRPRAGGRAAPPADRFRQNPATQPRVWLSRKIGRACDRERVWVSGV